MILYKLILYVIFFFVLVIGLGQLLHADENEVPLARTSPLFERIAMCESGGFLKARNPNSSASGEFQFISSSWYHYGLEYWGDKFYTKNIWTLDNRELAWYVYHKYGTSPWNASKECWLSVDT